MFLTFMFPKIVAYGRKWFSTSSTLSKSPPTPPVKSTNSAGLPLDASAFQPVTLTSGDGAVEDPVNIQDVMPPIEQKHGSGFDLAFLRWS
jgi:hypothetical protein